MNYETIENEIYNFTDEYFESEYNFIDENLDFIENNRLITPKVNYTHLYPFLALLMKRFEAIDNDFPIQLITKLSKDIKDTELFYGEFLNKTQSFKDVFKHQFIPFSDVIRDYNDSAKELKEKEEKSAEDFKRIKHMNLNLSELTKIYYELFESIFYERLKNINMDFKFIINTKIFYLDRFIWHRAKGSKRIIKELEVRRIHGELTPESYIQLVLSMMRPYTDEYHYLEECLRVYK